MWAASQSVPPWPGGGRPLVFGPLLFTSPVRAWNQGKGKCLATNWSSGWAEVNVVTPGGRGCAGVAVVKVGLVDGLLAAVPGPAHVAPSRPGTVLAWKEV